MRIDREKMIEELKQMSDKIGAKKAEEIIQKILDLNILMEYNKGMGWEKYRHKMDYVNGYSGPIESNNAVFQIGEQYVNSTKKDDCGDDGCTIFVSMRPVKSSPRS